LCLLFNHSSELVHIGVHSELNIESSFEHLSKVVVSHLSRDQLVDSDFIVGGKLITEHTFNSLEEIDIQVHVLVMTIQVAWLEVAVELAWF